MAIFSRRVLSEKPARWTPSNGVPTGRIDLYGRSLLPARACSEPAGGADFFRRVASQRNAGAHRSPNLKDGTITVIDLKDWKLVRTIPVPGPGFFMRSHEATPYAWTDSMMSPTAKDTLTIIDKRTLEPVAQVKEPGRTLAHIEFTRDGRYALASVWEMDGAIVVYDARTLKEVKRLPMSKPVGKYNVFNKITRSEGTSH